jgi:hypothetical protein
MKKDFNLNIFINAIDAIVESTTKDEFGDVGYSIDEWVCVNDDTDEFEHFYLEGRVRTLGDLATVLNHKGHRTSDGHIFTDKHLRDAFSRLRKRYPVKHLKSLVADKFEYLHSIRSLMIEGRQLSAGLYRDFAGYAYGGRYRARGVFY